MKEKNEINLKMERMQIDIEKQKIKEGKLLSTYNYNNSTIPFIVNSMNYWLDGENPEIIPADYFINPAAMVKFQTKKIIWHLKHIDDDYLPFLHPWFGTCVVPSAMGVEVVFPPNADPALKGSCISTPEQVYTLKTPDPYKDGLMPRVLNYIDYMKSNTKYPICVTDTQGPLNISLSIAGIENLFTWFYTNASEAHYLMDFSTKILIDWVSIQKIHAGLELNDGAFPHGIKLPCEFGGVCISDDDCTQIPAEIYKEFVAPYNSRVLKAFGGGTIHFCGNAEHQIENFCNIEGLTGVNNFCMGNFGQVYKMQEQFASRKIALMICDFAPVDVIAYYDDLFSKLKTEGTIIASFPTYSIGLLEGRYEQICRNPEELAKEIYEVLKTKVILSINRL